MSCRGWILGQPLNNLWPFVTIVQFSPLRPCLMSIGMARLIAILGLICLAGADVLLLAPDPWAKADAARIAELALQADRIGWRLTEDATLSRAMIWDREGYQHYPPPDGLAPVQYELSETETRRLNTRLSEVSASEWQPFDVRGREYLYCHDLSHFKLRCSSCFGRNGSKNLQHRSSQN